MIDFGNTKWLVMVDYYSNWIEILKLNKGSESGKVIELFKNVFSRFGIPLEVISDNGPQFASCEFANFVTAYDFIHITSDPLYPQSNGLAEKAVSIGKNLLRKASLENLDVALMNYRATPLRCGLSPSQLMFGGRLIRTKLLCTASALTSKEKTRVRIDRGAQKVYYDRAAKDLSELHVGDSVRLR